jgi:Family of unknown function (DUF6527)
MKRVTDAGRGVSRQPSGHRCAPASTIGPPSDAKWAVLACPCGTGHTIDLNIGNDGIPMSRVLGAVSPSIDVQDPAGRCHFWVRNGRVEWVQRPRSLQQRS